MPFREFYIVIMHHFVTIPWLVRPATNPPKTPPPIGEKLQRGSGKNSP
jgi:hypothetical protein